MPPKKPKKKKAAASKSSEHQQTKDADLTLEEFERIVDKATSNKIQTAATTPSSQDDGRTSQTAASGLSNHTARAKIP